MIGNLFGGLFGQDTDGGSNNDQPTTTILDIPASTVKIGPLKFYLQIFLVGEQNKPVTGSWVLNQNDDRGTLDMYYTDGTAMFSIDLKEYGIKILRYGQKPSLQYMLQESVLLHGLLDELEQLAFGVEEDEIAEENRLLQFAEGDKEALETARETLPARASKEEAS